MRWLENIGQRFVGRVLWHLGLLTDPESMIGWFLVTLWCVLAGLTGGPIWIMVLLAVGWFVHGAAVETGNHVLLWVATAMLLILVVLASEATFDGLPPVLLAAAGSSALLYNELVRLNYTRRRNATVHEAVYQASGVALAIAAAIGVVGVALIQVFSSGASRSWLWMPAAAAALLAVGFALSLGPIRRATEASKERWQPGGRIPPQPLKGEPTEF